MRSNLPAYSTVASTTITGDSSRETSSSLTAEIILNTTTPPHHVGHEDMLALPCCPTEIRSVAERQHRMIERNPALPRLERHVDAYFDAGSS